MKRENYFDKMVTSYFDQLWANPFYLNFMGQTLKNSFAVRQQWNKQLEKMLELWQLPNQQLQQRTLHLLNTLASEWRFEREEMQERMDKLEAEIQSLQALVKEQSASQTAAKAAAKPAKAEGK